MKPNWDAIRKHYRIVSPLIFAVPRNDWGINPYAWDKAGLIRLTPIEESLWMDIRQAGAVLYPQYPVGRFFVDFANPVAKVAIECDGAAWHLDKERDEQRDRELSDLGWRVYRITGRDCKTDFDYEACKPGAAAEFIASIVKRHRIKEFS